MKPTAHLYYYIKIGGGLIKMGRLAVPRSNTVQIDSKKETINLKQKTGNQKKSERLSGLETNYYISKRTPESIIILKNSIIMAPSIDE